MKEAVSCYKFLSTFLGKSKWIVFGSVITTSFLSSMCNSIIIMTCLNCCKVFWWFYCDGKVNTLFVWFGF